MSRWRTLGPVAALAVAVVAGILLTRGDDRTDAPPATTVPAPVAVTSDAPRATRLEALVASADLIVEGEVTRTARGRVFGDPAAGTAIESRLVTLEVTRVLRGDAPAGAILVEEEGWTADGAPLVVDGAAPSATGDRGVWFLTAVEGPAGPAYVTVSAQGRLLVVDGRLRAASGDDPLLAALVRLEPAQLVDQIAALPG